MHVARALLSSCLVALIAAAPALAGEPPANDECPSCTVIDAVPFADAVDTSTALPGLPPGSCNLGSAKVMENDVWYCFTPKADCLLTLAVDYSAVDGEGYDGLTAIYSGPDCKALVEIDCLDSGFGTSDDDATMLAASGGTTYWFQIGKWGTTPSGGPTTVDVDCQVAGENGACCFEDGSCIETDVLGCLEAGGLFSGAGTSCDPNECPQPPIGACCFCDGPCQVLLEIECDEKGGDYQGDGTDCDTTECPKPPPNDLCVDAIDLGGVPSAATGNTCCATDEDTGFCGTSSPNQGVWYSIVGDGETYRASTCNSGSDFDTKIQVFEGTCDELVCVDGNDDAAGAPPECSLNGLNRFSRVDWVTEPGVTYYIYVGGFGSACGNFELTVTVPMGRCCYTCQADTDGDNDVDVDDLVAVILSWNTPGTKLNADVNNDGIVDVDDLVAVIVSWGECDPFLCAQTSELGCDELRGTWTEGLDCEESPCFGACCFCEDSSCAVVTEEDCAAAGGLYQGDGTLCEGLECPMLPPNDACADALELSIPGSAIENTCCANDDDTPTCDTSAPGRGIWYVVVGTGDFLTATTCNPATDFDTKIQVFCNVCDEFVCVAGDDDDDACDFGLASTVQWCSIPGEEYYIHVGGLGAACGTVELSVSAGDVCDEKPVICELPLGRCCIPGTTGTVCQDLTEPACDTAGGSWVEGLSCDTDPCPVAYAVEPCDSPFENIVDIGNDGPTGDDAGMTVPIGFTFSFFGVDHEEIGISTNGYLTFGTDQTDFSNDPIPTTTDPNDLIAPFWDDYNLGDGGEIHLITLDEPLRLIVQWTAVAEFNTKGADTATFQAVLFPDGSIEFRYGPLIGVPSSDGDVTIGVEDPLGETGTGVPGDSVEEGDCLRFFLP